MPSNRNADSPSFLATLPISLWFLAYFVRKDLVGRFGLRMDSLRRWNPGVFVHTFLHPDAYTLLASVLQHIIAMKDEGSRAPDVVGGMIGSVFAGIVFVCAIPSSMWMSRSALEHEQAAQLRAASTFARLVFDVRGIVQLILTLLSLPARPSSTLLALLRCGEEVSNVSVVLCGGSSLNSAIRGYRCAYNGYVGDDFSRHGALLGLALIANRNESRLAALLPVCSYICGSAVGWLVRLVKKDLAQLLLPRPLLIPAEITEKASPGEAGIVLTVFHKGRRARVLLYIPHSCFCPITHEIMSDPVRTHDGFTFEREAITKWIEGSDISPLTNLPLVSKSLQTDYETRRATKEVIRQYNELMKVRPQKTDKYDDDVKDVFFEYID